VERGYYIGKKLEECSGIETRVVVLGHVQRGGSPTAFDRVLATRYGIAAIDLVHEGKFGRMVALQGNKIVSVPLKDVVGKKRTDGCPSRKQNCFSSFKRRCWEKEDG